MIKFEDVQFPVYSIRGFSDTRTEGTQFFVDNGYGFLILDDTSLPGSLGIRRLHLLSAQHVIYPLSVMYSTWDQLLSRSNKTALHSLFIDNTGYVFNHKPSINVVIEYKRLRKQVVKPRSHTLLYLQGETHPIKVSSPFSPGLYYCGVGRVNNKLVLFDVASEPKGKTWRKI